MKTRENSVKLGCRRERLVGGTRTSRGRIQEPPRGVGCKLLDVVGSVLVIIDIEMLLLLDRF